MQRVRSLLAVRNGKLGSSIFHFDLPAVATCPGRSAVCERVCYATHGRFATRRVRARLAWCRRQSLRDDFARRVSGEVRAKGCIVVRIHVSGDFYDAVYTGKWLEVAARHPKVRFYAYTRSWRVPEVVPVLEALAALPNVRLWYSCDTDTGEPASVPAGVRLAFLQHAEIAVPRRARLVFRTRSMRPKPRVGLPVVCPQETNRSVNCGSCQHCWA